MTITVTYQGLTTSMSWIYLRQTGKYEYHHLSLFFSVIRTCKSLE